MGQLDLKIYDSLVSSIYDAASDPALWDAFLARLAQAFNGQCAILRIYDPQSHYPHHNSIYGFGEAFTKDYCDHFYKYDPIPDVLDSVPTGTVITRAEKIPDKQFNHAEFFADFVHRWDLNDLVGTVFLHQGENTARIGVHRVKGVQQFGEEDKCMMSLLVPHLQRAFHISRYIQTIKVKNEAAENVLDQLPFGVVLVNGSGKPVIVNRKAKALNKHNDGLSVTCSGIHVVSSTDTQALRQLIKDACGKARKGGTLALDRPSSQLPLTLLATPLNPELRPLGAEADQPMAVIFICDPEDKRNICIETLRQLYGLTKAEAKLASSLAEGQSLDEIASRTSVSKHTLRTQLKCVFNKTGLNRQSDIIKLILGGPASLLP